MSDDTQPTISGTATQGMSPTTGSSSVSDGMALTKEQNRYCLAIIRQLKRSTASEAFRAPVDHAGMGLVDYLSVVKQPMDLGTVERKLGKGEYAGVGEFAADVQRIWDNCYLYNGRENYYSQQAQLLESTFHNHLRKMPQQALGSNTLEDVLPEKVLSPMSTSGSPMSDGAGVAVS